MIVELGNYALVLALLISIAQSVVPLIGASRRQWGLMEVGSGAATASFLLIAFAFAALINAYVTSDFSVLNVVENSHTDKPLLYKITGVWGNHEGSMILWVFMLTLFGAMVAWFGNNLPPELKARVLAVQGMIGTGFLVFILLTSDPFQRVIPAPANGQGMNPVLQDPGLAFHPPFLYLGYVGFSVSFSFAVAALIEGRVDAAWARWVRPWNLAAWCALTIGIAMGSWWAYYTLGWGGWWFWDPVENASLMPWLAGTALIHSAIVVEKRDTLKSWTVLLAILTFSLSLVGTFLVRSGVLESVHAFAVDPQRGTFILVLLIIAIGGSLGLYAVRAPALKAGGLFAPISREGALVLNNILLSCALATVFLGTLYPLFLDAVGGPKVSVGYPFFNRTFVPLAVPLLAALGVGPMMAWKRGDLVGGLQRLWAAFAGAILVLLVGIYLVWGGPVMSVFGFAIAAWVALAALVEWSERVHLFRAGPLESLRRAIHLPRSAYGMTIAHIGVAVAVAGFSATAFDQERIQELRPGQHIEMAGFTLDFAAVDEVPGPNYSADRGDFVLRRGDRIIAELHPERRFFPLQQVTTAETAIRSNFVSDYYLALGDPDGKGGWAVRAYWKPLVPWIWIGAVIMAFGGLASLSDRRWRVGAAVRRRRPAPVPAPAE